MQKDCHIADKDDWQHKHISLRCWLKDSFNGKQHSLKVKISQSYRQLLFPLVLNEKFVMVSQAHKPWGKINAFDVDVDDNGLGSDMIIYPLHVLLKQKPNQFL